MSDVTRDYGELGRIWKESLYWGLAAADAAMRMPAGVEPIAFVVEAKQEMLRLIVDVQQNRNRPEDLP